jgi:YD repeat-containing protein
MVEYDLDYQFVEEQWPGLEWIVNTAPHETTRLTSITKWGWNEAGQKKSLPATTFVYGNGGGESFEQGDNSVDPIGPNYGGKLRYPRMWSMDNGYGGHVAFTYNTGAPYNYRGVYSYVATQKSVNDGMGHTSNVQYTYTDPCFSGYNDWPNCRHTALDAPTYAVVGHKQTAVTVYDYNGAFLSKTVYAFHTDDNVIRGQAYKTESYDANNTLLQRTDATWGIQAFGPGTLNATTGYLAQTMSTEYSGVVPVTNRTSYTYDEYGNLRAEYRYGVEERIVNPGFESGSEGWGFWQMPTPPAGVTSVTSFAGRSSMKLETSNSHGAVSQEMNGLVPGETYVVRVWVKASESTTADFELRLHDSTQWIGSGRIAPPTSSWAPVSVSFTAKEAGTVKIDLHYYDGSGTIYVDEVAVARAEDVGDEQSIHHLYFNLTDNNRWFIGLKRGENIFDTIMLNRNDPQHFQTQTIWYYDDKTYNKNAWGASGQIDKGEVTMIGQGYLLDQTKPFVTSTMTYDTWGNLTSQTDPNGNETSITYDDAYHQFPTTQCSAVGKPEMLCAYTNYYGVNAATISGSFGHFGQVQRTYDDNGTNAATVMTYDAFGRLRKIVRPGDSPAYPTEEYQYFDGGDQIQTNTWPFLVSHLIRGNSGVGWNQGGVWHVGTRVLRRLGASGAGANSRRGLGPGDEYRARNRALHAL